MGSPCARYTITLPLPLTLALTPTPTPTLTLTLTLTLSLYLTLTLTRLRVGWCAHGPAADARRRDTHGRRARGAALPAQGGQPLP